MKQATLVSMKRKYELGGIDLWKIFGKRFMESGGWVMITLVKCLSYVYVSKKAHIEKFLYVPYIQCDPGGIRTLDPLIKSQLLCQLSYGV